MTPGKSGAEAEVRQVTTRKRRWLRAFGVQLTVTLVALLVMGFAANRAVAQPFASIIMDARSGEVLASTNANARLHPASLTKMMTLYIAFEAVENGEIDLDTRVQISRHAASQPPSRLGLRAGQRIAFRYLIRAAALRSANDAAAAIAEALEGSVANFAARMNRTAQAIGMTRTHFANPHGLTTDGHLSTARDMATLGRQLYFDYPDYYNIFSRLSDDAGIATVRNTNRAFLNSYRGADGIKTGFTNAAGYNLAAMAERDGVRILVVVMGARSSAHRLQQVTQLMDRGFRMAPRRAAVRRPSRPDYVHAPEDSGNGPAAGRVIRLQTAPTASRFPRPRPLPGEAPSDEMIASLRDDIDAVIADIRQPDPETDTEETGYPSDMTSEEPDEVVAAPAEAPAEEATETVAAVAPERSPVPRVRPGEAGSPVVARAGVSADATQAVAALVQTAVPEARPELPSSPVRFEHSDLAIADVAVRDGLVVIPGLPPIATDLEATARAEGLDPALVDPGAEPGDEIAAAPAQPAEVALAQIEPVVPELAVGEDGRILWRDEELLSALSHEDPEDPVLTPTIVLTTSEAAEATDPPPMPEIVTRVSTSGGRLWAVELGLYPSRFDAERVLLRLALSENATPGSGVRRVVSRAGRFAAEVHSLSEDEAQTACLRLVARDHPCSVMTP